MVFDSFDIKSLIRPVIDFPKPGVIFRDITPLFQSPTALRLVMEQADMVNAYVDANKPWELGKDPANNARLQEVCSRLLEAFRILTIY